MSVVKIGFSTPRSMVSVDEIQKLRHLAFELGKLVDREPYPARKAEFLDLAIRCETAANYLAGNGSRRQG